MPGGRSSTPPICPSEYIAGAMAGSQKRWCALRMPITSPLSPKMTTVGSMMRSSATVSASCPGDSPGESTYSP